MGQKVNPISLRIGHTKGWRSRWLFAPKSDAVASGKYPYAKYLEEDEAIRKVIKKKIALAGIAGVEIERTSNHLRVLIRAARPGFVIGQGGKGIENLTKTLETTLKKVRMASGSGGAEKAHLSVNVEELKRSEISAAYVGQQIAWDIEKRLPFRRALKKHLESIMQNREVKGAKITLAGRLNGAEIARTETLRRGELPLQTLRTDIDYHANTAFTTYGAIGIKVWVYKGEAFGKQMSANPENGGRNQGNREAQEPRFAGGRQR